MRSTSVLVLPVLLLVLGGTGWAAGATKPGAVTRAQFKSWQRTGEVTDLANLLDEAVEAKLRNQAREVRAKSGVDLAVATLPGLPSEHWSKELVALARRWEVGGRDKGLGNTGVLLAIIPHEGRWVLLWGYPGKGAEVVFATERGGRPSFVGLHDKQLPVKPLADEFRVLAHLYAAYYGFALAPSGPTPEPGASTAAEPTAGIDDPVNLLDAQARARLEVTLDDVRRHTGAAWIVKTIAGSAEDARGPVDPQQFVEAVGLKDRLKDRRSGDLLVLVRASDGSGNFTVGAALQAALHVEPSAFRRLPLHERERTRVAPSKTLELSLRDLARRYAAHGGWALSPRWTKSSGLPPLSPDASIQWTPATPHRTPSTPPSSPVAHRASGSGQSWGSGGVVSSPRTTSLVGTMLGAYAPLMGLLWFWLTARALVVDRRAAWVRLLGVCLLGAPCWTALIALFSAGVFSSSRERLGDGLAAFFGALGGALLGFMLVEAVANPTFKDRRGRYRSYFDVRNPSLSARWQRPGLILCRWGLAGVGLGSLALGVAFGFAGDPVASLNSGGLQPTHVAMGLAIALALVGLIKVAVAEFTRAR